MFIHLIKSFLVLRFGKELLYISFVSQNSNIFAKVLINFVRSSSCWRKYYKKFDIGQIVWIQQGSDALIPRTYFTVAGHRIVEALTILQDAVHNLLSLTAAVSEPV
jgi:hypothetical protein